MIYKTLLTFLLSNLVVVAQGATFKARFMSTLSLATFLAPFIYIGDKITNWVMCNNDYMHIVLGAIFVDYVVGTINYLLKKKKDDKGHVMKASLKYNALGLCTKLFVAVAGGFLFEGLNHLVSEVNILFDALKIITRVVVFLYPAISAWDNLSIFSNGKFPPKKWLKIATKTYNEMDINELKKKE